MSLINDALKKAQRDRALPAEQHSPGAAAPAASPAHSTAAPRRSTWPIALIVLAVVGGGTAVWFLKPSGQPAPAVATAAPAPTPAPASVTTPTGQATAPISPAASAPTEPTLQFNLSTAAAQAPTTAATPAPVPPAAPAVAQTPPPPAAAPTQEPLKITLQMEDPRILAFLDAARINGVRAVADDAKLSMNGKVFRAGSVVDRELGLKLVQIRPSELVFEDSHGIQYRKPL